MREEDVLALDVQAERYSKLSNYVDVVNALYTFSQLHNPKGIMKDLCDALDVDGYYNLIDQAFKLPKLQSRLVRYELQVRLKLGQITTLAQTEWQIAYGWAVGIHKQSKTGTEFFCWQKFRAEIQSVRITENELNVLLQELDKPVCRKRASYIDFLHYKLGYMPYYFSAQTKSMYSDAIRERAKICCITALK